MKLTDDLPKELPISANLLANAIPDVFGTIQIIVDYENIVYLLVIHQTGIVDVLFMYSSSDKYDERFIRNYDEDIKGTFVKNNNGGSIFLEFQKGGN